MSKVVSTFTEDQVHRLTGVSRSQLRYWDRIDFYAPSSGYIDQVKRVGRLYDFRDLVCLKVVNSLRNEAKVSLQHLREVKDELLSLGDDVWTRTTLYVLNKRVVVYHPDREAMEEVVSKQGVLQIPLKIIAENMSDAIARLDDRGKDDPEIERAHAIGGKPYVIAGTRIAVSHIKEFASAGYTIEQIAQQYPALSKQEIAAALAFDPAA